MSAFHLALGVLLFGSALNGCATVTPPQHYEADAAFRPVSPAPTSSARAGRALCFDRGHHNLAVERGFYRPVLHLAASDGFEVIEKTGRFDAASLRGCRVLYVSAVLGHEDYSQRELARRPAFTPDEIDAIEAWVRQGGGLLVATDHRPMSDAAATLLLRFGFEGSRATAAEPDYPVPPFRDPGIFRIEGERLETSHPVLRGRNPGEQVRQVYFFYGEALRGPRESVPLLRLSASARIGEDEAAGRTPREFPAVAIASAPGRGRVTVFGDGTIFTSKIDLANGEKTGMNREGSDNVRLALNVFRWLAGEL